MSQLPFKTLLRFSRFSAEFKIELCAVSSLEIHFDIILLSKFLASITDWGSASFEKRRSKWCAPSNIVIAITESERLVQIPPGAHGSRLPLLKNKMKLKYFTFFSFSGQSQSILKINYVFSSSFVVVQFKIKPAYKEIWKYFFKKFL